MKKLIFSLFAFVIASLCFGQNSIWRDQNIRIPKSSVPQLGRCFTHYVVYNGPRLRGNTIRTDGEANGRVHPDRFHPDFNPDGFHPADIHAAYKITDGQGTGAIAVVIAFHNPNILTDFQTFSAQFGLPTETSTDPLASTNKHFQLVYAQGSQPQSDSGWAGESSLDVEWTHAMAPNAKIYLVEAADNGDNLFNAIPVAASLPGVKEVSMSFGARESSGETAFESLFATGVVYFASAGDAGGVTIYPSASQFVVSVGGTSLVLNNDKSIKSETAWSDSGGGPSAFIARPSYQSPVASKVGSSRGTPDISAVADPFTGVAVFSQFGFGGWAVVGGTSVSCPISAGIANARAQWTNDPITELTRIYHIYTTPALFKQTYRDITQGTAGGFTAGPGWDFITGIGAPNGMYALSSLNAIPATNAQVIVGNEVGSNPFDLTSVLQRPYGQTAATSADFVLANPLSTYLLVEISAQLTSPLRTTGQIFIYNPSTQKYEIVASTPGTGSPSALTKDVTSYLNTYSFTYNGQTIMRFAFRGVEPIRASEAPFTFVIGSPTLYWLHT